VAEHYTAMCRVSIHAFREEGDERMHHNLFGNVPFQSTPSGRKATLLTGPTGSTCRVSIHAFREEGDYA